MKIAVFIQCRLNSSRLPGKALLKLSDSTILGMLIKRSTRLGFPTYLLTSNCLYDSLLEKESIDSGANGVFRGDLNDVQSRFINAGRELDCKYIARVTADNPLTYLDALNGILKLMESNYYDYCSIDSRFCPEGCNLEVFTKDILERSRVNDTSDYNKEHVTPWIIGNSKSGDYKNDVIATNLYKKSSKFSVTIDTLEDYFKVSQLIYYCEKFKKNTWKDENFVHNCIDAIVNKKLNYPSGRTYEI